jgi:hypothetical protein
VIRSAKGRRKGFNLRSEWRRRNGGDIRKGFAPEQSLDAEWPSKYRAECKRCNQIAFWGITMSLSIDRFGYSILLICLSTLAAAVSSWMMKFWSDGRSLAGEAGAGDQIFLAQLREKFGLDQPLPVQLFLYVKGILSLDLGFSFRQQMPVATLILQRLPATLLLTGTAFAISLAFGILFGALAARFAGTWADTAITVAALVFYATPLFWVALMAILLFSVAVDWLPSFGYESVGANYTGLAHVLDVAAHLGLSVTGLAAGANRKLFKEQKSAGEIRKMVAMDGHQGPKEINVQPEFLSWLTDPVKNGAGALFDFGCYGANLMTWLMKGQAPISVTAVARHIKPAIYPKVDDDATILLEYPDATGIIEASWNWPFGIKDMEVFGQKGYLHALNGNTLEQRDTNTYYKVAVKPLIYPDNLSYLSAALKGEVKSSDDLSSLENNLIVVRILEAARKSAKEGKRIVLEKN